MSPASCSDHGEPKVALVIAAYNEEDSIAARLDNVLGLDYPADKLQVLVASDGSTDATERIVAGYEDRGVKLLSLPRRGKIHALNDAVGKATGEILVKNHPNNHHQYCKPGIYVEEQKQRKPKSEKRQKNLLT